MFLNGAMAQKFRDFLTGASSWPSSGEELALVLNGEEGEARRIVTIAVLDNPQDRGSPIFLLSIGDLFKTADTSRMQQLMRLFRLTQAEEKLAGYLARGGKLNDAARMFSLSRHTVRNQLRSIFEKVGVHRQADLTRVMCGYAYTSHGKLPLTDFDPLPASTRPGSAKASNNAQLALRRAYCQPLAQVP